MAKVLFQITGSIAAFKACQALSDLVKAGYDVQTVASKAALEFVGPATLEGLTGHPVLTEISTEGRRMDHIHLARSADLFVLCPATANAINRLAAGLADDLIGALFLAAERSKPYLVFPAMNHQMLQHPATQKSIETLRKWGVKVLDTGKGSLACGETGEGRLLEPEQIVRAIQKALEPQSKGRVLVTLGGTQEPIDDVRMLTNKSTGATGSAIAERLAEAGWTTVVLKARNARAPQNSNVQIQNFVTTKDLEDLLRKNLKEVAFDAVIHAAAVSDYSPPSQAGKISSQSDALHLELKKNPKLVNHIKEWSKNPKTRLVAFKLTSGEARPAIESQVANLFEKSHADFVVHNDLVSLPRRTIFFRGGNEIATLDEKELSVTLERLCAEERL